MRRSASTYNWRANFERVYNQLGTFRKPCSVGTRKHNNLLVHFTIVGIAGFNNVALFAAKQIRNQLFTCVQGTVYAFAVSMFFTFAWNSWTEYKRTYTPKFSKITNLQNQTSVHAENSIDGLLAGTQSLKFSTSMVVWFSLDLGSWRFAIWHWFIFTLTYRKKFLISVNESFRFSPKRFVLHRFLLNARTSINRITIRLLSTVTLWNISNSTEKLIRLLRALHGSGLARKKKWKPERKWFLSHPTEGGGVSDTGNTHRVLFRRHRWIIYDVHFRSTVKNWFIGFSR